MKLHVRSDEDYMYFSLLIVSFLCLFGGFLYKFWLSSYISLPPCLFHEYLGLYCPACGGTRSFLALLSGDILLSVYFHPIVLYAVCIIGIYLVLQTIDRLRGKEVYTMPFSIGFVYAGIGLLLCNWIFRNILLLYFHIAL